jgi:uncharacterized protein YkwD
MKISHLLKHSLLALGCAILFIPAALAAPNQSTLPPAFTRSAAKATAAQDTATRIQQSDARLAKIETLILEYVNDARRKARLNALVANSTLAEVARAHSAEMRDKSYFAHESPTPELRDPLDRFLAVFNNSPHLLAENIFRSWGSRHEIREADALRAHNSLMNSPGHRANILRASVTQIGIGVIANENGDLWVTQNFIRP